MIVPNKTQEKEPENQYLLATKRMNKSALTYSEKCTNRRTSHSTKQLTLKLGTSMVEVHNFAGN